MSTTETDRLHLYEVARRQWDDSAATTLMNLLPPDADKLATKDDVALTTAVLRTDMADLRTEMADLRTEVAHLVREQTRTIMLGNIGMWLSVAGLVVGLRFT
jgi:hypothetical protein